MQQIAIVEDDRSDCKILTDYLGRYMIEKKQNFQVRCFSDAASFISDDQSKFDIVLMDILMPGMDGMDAAKILRKTDETSCLIFVTNLSNFAVEGYEVNAMDYLLKPVKYARFSEAMDKAVEYCAFRRSHTLLFKTVDGLVRLESSDVYYIHSYKHYVYIQTLAEEYRVRASMKDMEQQLYDQMFFRCDNSYIVNLEHVSQINKDTAIVGSWEIPVSRMRRKNFVNCFTCYLGELS